MTASATDPPQGLARAGSVVQILSGAVGLGAYIALAGGVAEWARMSGAGLPASQALGAIDPISLLASGFQTLLLVPGTLAASYLAVRVEVDVRRSPEKPAAVAIAQRGWKIGTQLVILVSAVTLSMLVAALVLALMIRVAGSAALVVAIAAATVVLVALLLARVVVRPAGSAAVRRRLPRLVRDQPDFIAGVPWVVRSVVIAVTRAAWATLVFLAVTTIVCVLLMASAVVKGGLHVGSVHIHDISAGVFVGAFVVLGLVFAVVLVAVVGRLWLQQAAAREAAAQRDEAHQQARSSVAVVGWLIVIVVLVPFSYAVILVPLMFVGLFSDAYGDKEHLLARLLVFSLALALGLMGLQAHSPQRFDRLELAIPQHGRSKPLRVRVALIGSTGGAYVIAACDRVRYEELGEMRWKSSRPVLLRLPLKDVADAEIVSHRYAFAQPNETSILGAVASMIVGIPAPGIAASPFGSLGQRDVCGGVDHSATDARIAVRRLAEDRG